MKKIIARPILDKLYQEFSVYAASVIEGGDELPPQLVAFNLEKDEPHILFNMPQAIMKLFQGSEQGKTYLRVFVEKTLVGDAPGGLPAPDIMLYASEAWTAKGIVGDKLFEETLRTGDVKSRPDRTESVIVTLYTLDGTALGVCPIHIDANKKRSLEVEPLHHPDDPGLELDGRLVVDKPNWEVPK